MTDEKRKHPFTCFYTEILEKIIAFLKHVGLNVTEK